MLSSTPMFEVLSIPELLDAVQVFLSPHDLVQCAAVSKSFQAIFTALLWETIAIKTHHQHVAFTTVPEVQDALVRNAHHARVIYLRTCKSLEPFLRVDPTHLKLLHTVAFPWTLSHQDQEHYYQDSVDIGELLPSSVSTIYTPPPFSLQSQRGTRISYGGIDRIVAQQDWLRAKGMFPGLEQAVGTQFRYLQRLQDQQRRQAEIAVAASAAASAAAGASMSSPPASPPASSSSLSSTSAASSSASTSASANPSTDTAAQQQQPQRQQIIYLQAAQQQAQVQAQLLAQQQAQQQAQLQAQQQAQLQAQQQAQQQAQLQAFQQAQQQAQVQAQLQLQAQQQAQQQALLQEHQQAHQQALQQVQQQQQPAVLNQQHQQQLQLQLHQLQNQLQQGMHAQQAQSMLHFQVLQQQSRQASQHGLQHHSLQLGIPQIILAANQQMAAQAQATAQTLWLIQQMSILESREQAVRRMEADRRALQFRRTDVRQNQEALDIQQASLLASQRLVHLQNPRKDYSPSRQAALRIHEQSLLNAERQFVFFHGIVHQHKTLSPQEHQQAQTQVDQYLPVLQSLQQAQMRIVPIDGQEQQQQVPSLGPAMFQQQQGSQLTLVRLMERLQLCIEVLPRIQAYLDSGESITEQPWFVDNAEDEQQLVRFMVRFSGLKAFGSTNLLLSNKEVWDSMGHFWSDLRVLSLVLFKHVDGQPPQRHLELAALLDRCPTHLESLQLSFSEKDFSYHPSSHVFTRVNDDIVATLGTTTLKDIPTLRRAFIEGQMGGTANMHDVETWIQFLGRCPNLQSLALGSSTSQVIRLVAAKAMNHWPMLEELATSIAPSLQLNYDAQFDQSVAMLLNATCRGSVEGVDNNDDEMISAGSTSSTLLQRRRGMRKVRLDRFVFISQSATLQSLFRLSKTLTHLSMRDYQFPGGSPSDTLLRLLRACDRLEEVDLLPSGSYYRVILMPLSAQEFVKLFSLKTSPWPSARTLKVLRVAIGGLGRTPLAVNVAAGPSSAAGPLPSTTMSPSSMLYSSGLVDPAYLNTGSFASSSSSSVPMQSPLEVLYELQREVCQILGSFTALEELSLGVHTEQDQMCSLLPHMFQQGQCLEMMLESGLNLMGELRQLRVLNISRMAHRVGVTELQWMRDNWPRLHTVLGLLRVANLNYQNVSNTGTSVSTSMATEEKERREEVEDNEKWVKEWVKENFSQLVFT